MFTLENIEILHPRNRKSVCQVLNKQTKFKSNQFKCNQLRFKVHMINFHASSFSLPQIVLFVPQTAVLPV